MSQISKNKCDHCNKETEDRYIEVDWIQITGGSITISKGRKTDRSADTKYINLETSRSLDFCCLACLVAYLKTEPAVTPTACKLCGKIG